MGSIVHFLVRRPIRITRFPFSDQFVLYALSLRQPWAALLIAGRKSIEVRSWSTPKRGSILIHASKIVDEREEAWKWVTEPIRPLTELRGGIIGRAQLTDCMTYTDPNSFEAATNLHLNDPSWFALPRLHGFVFSNPEPIPFRKCRGQTRFFLVSEAEADV